MNLPFTPQQFFDVFTQYNRAVWPLQIILFVIALAAAVAVCVRPHHFSRLALYLLAALWLWVAGSGR